MGHALGANVHSILESLQNLAHAIHQESPKQLDELLSFGERLSAELFTAALEKNQAPAAHFDARTLITTNSFYGKAEPQIAAIKENCAQLLLPALNGSKILVTEGFIGRDIHGNTTTLGRGGSDYSAALLAEGIEASNLEIWTDVSGILTMDPRTVKEAKIIREISFAEAAELANFGAKVLHPATLLPAMRSKTVVFVKNTFSPFDAGTKIYAELSEKPLFRAVAVRNNQTLITVSSLRMLNAHGFLAKIFALLAEHELSVDLVTTSEVSVALTIDGTSLGSSGKGIKENKALFDALSTIADVRIEENLSVIALIGNHLTQNAGIAARAFACLEDVNVRLICQGASHNNLCFLVDSSAAADAAVKLHRAFL
jgi:aspartate kinase